MRKIFLVNLGLYRVFRKDKNSLTNFSWQGKFNGGWRFSILNYSNPPICLYFNLQGPTLSHSVPQFEHKESDESGT